MPNYTGCQCIVCQNTFQKEDDIVVCPDCGTPYHRSCYAAKGTCINTALHQNGGSWQDLHRKKLEERECPNCHHINEPDAAYCSICHAPIRGGQGEGAPDINIVLPNGQTMRIDPHDPCCGLDPEEEFDGARLGDVAEFVETNTLYYLPLFKRFKETGKKLSVNLPCLLFPHLYFANRKMWLMCLVTILIMTVCSIPSMLTSIAASCTAESTIEMYQSYGVDINEMFGGLIGFVETNQSLITSLDMVLYCVQLTVRVVLCVFANWLYYRHAVSRVKRVCRSQISGATKRILLRSDGGTNFLNMIGALGITAAVFMGTMMLLMMPFMMG